MVPMKGEASPSRNLSLALFLFCKFIFCVGVWAVCTSVHHTCTLCSRRSEEDVRIPGTGITDMRHHDSGRNQTPVLSKTSSALKC